jgi:hypothetical protein
MLIICSGVKRIVRNVPSHGGTASIVPPSKRARVLLLFALAVLSAACGDAVCPECDDDDPCTIGTCIDDTCVLTPACDDGDPCTVDACAADGTCSNVPLCDDGLGCTIDTCNPDGSCEFTPVDAICHIPRTCMTSTCAVAPIPGPGQRVVEGTTSGCFNLLDDGYCTDEWDGCACNGAEMCVGSFGDVTSGCGPASTRDLWPCDAAETGDGNGCTEENCCEPWDPGGCRIHAQWAANTPEGEVPQLEQFCAALGDDAVSVDTPLGAVECIVGDHQYGVPAIVPDLGIPVPADKQDGYWCEDCQPCTTDACVIPSGVCTNTSVPDGTSIPDPPDPWLPPFVTLPDSPVCATPQFCDDETNFGCGRDACFSGQCRSGPNPGGESTCSGFPVVEFDDAQQIPAFPGEGASTCFELGCNNIGSIALPHWTCLAQPHDSACATDLFCDGPGTCSFDALCGNCSEEDAGAILASIATRFEDALPAAGNLVFGCEPPQAASPCDDGVECTIDLCSEGNEGCSHIPDDRRCAGDDWAPCDPAAVCLEGEGCFDPGNEPACPSTDECPLDCTPLDNGRLCLGEAAECGENVCISETYLTVPLDPIVDLCPFHPDGEIPEGDREFFGHGPVVSVDVSLEISADRQQILARVHFEARETMADFSTIRWDSPPVAVYTTSEEIVSIVSETRGHAFGISADGGTWGIACGGCGIVDFTTYDGIITHAEARGDTPDDDISHDDDCNTADTLLQLVELADAEIFLRADGCLE